MLVDSILNNSGFKSEQARNSLIANIPNAKINSKANEIMAKMGKDHEGSQFLNKVAKPENKELYVAGYYLTIFVSPSIQKIIFLNLKYFANACRF